MTDTLPPPIHFANRLIRKLVDNLLGPDMMILPADYLLLRLAFKSRGGTWEGIIQGDMTTTRLIENLIVIWGKQDTRIRQTEMT